jgi:hypothetical protein
MQLDQEKPMTDPVTVEQRHRDAAARYESWRSVEDLSTAFARFDHERNATLERENAALREHIAEQITHVETRIQDGIEMGATVWRIALEDVARENRNALGGQP